MANTVVKLYEARISWAKLCVWSEGAKIVSSRKVLLRILLRKELNPEYLLWNYMLVTVQPRQWAVPPYSQKRCEKVSVELVKKQHLKHLNAGGIFWHWRLTHKVLRYLHYKAIYVIFRWVERITWRNILSKLKSNKVARGHGVLEGHTRLSPSRAEFLSLLIPNVTGA